MGRDAKGNNQAPHQLTLAAAVPTPTSPERSSFYSKMNTYRGSDRRQTFFGGIGEDMHLFIKHLLNIHCVPSTSIDSSSLLF